MDLAASGGPCDRVFCGIHIQVLQQSIQQLQRHQAINHLWQLDGFALSQLLCLYFFFFNEYEVPPFLLTFNMKPETNP